MLILKSVNFEQQKFQHHHLKPAYPGQVEWVIGRSTECDLILASPEVSRIHGRILYADDTYHFADIGSTSGSLLNGIPVTAHDKAPLEVGDLLQLGETFLYVEQLSPLESGLAETHGEMGIWQPDQPWTGDLTCQCRRIVDETIDVKTFYFTAEPAMLFSYQPGQFINLAVDINGQTVIRPYSISSSPTRPHHLSITVKRVPCPIGQPDVPAGLVSNWLHDHLQVGDRVQIMGGPLGRFTCLPHIPDKLLLISAGSGITPMMSMSRWIQDTLTNCDVVFWHSARTPEDIIFRPELEAIAAQMPNFHLVINLTQNPAGRPWMGLMGRISEDMLRLVVPDFCDRQVYVCGPNGFMDHLRSLLQTMQFPMQNYQEESFGQPSPTRGLSHPIVTQPAICPDTSEMMPRDTGTIYFAQADVTVPSDGKTSILDLAEQAGVSIRSACRMGVCGACKVKVSQGQVTYETHPSILTESDQEAGYALACVAYPMQDVSVET